MLKAHRSVLLSLVALASAGITASADEVVQLNERASVAVRIRDVKKLVKLEWRLLVGGEFTEDGLKITSVQPGGPSKFMLRDVRRILKKDENGNVIKYETYRIQGALEAGDVIRKVNDVPVGSPEDYFKALNMATKEDPTAIISVWCVREKKSYDWLVWPARVQVIGEPPVRPPAKRASAVKVLIVADTADSDLGWGFSGSLAKVKDALKTCPGLAEKDLEVLSGKEVTPRNIRAAIEGLQVKEDEALVYYHLGHGAYDATRARGDVSKGHWFSFGDRGYLMRKDVRELLVGKKARLTVMISDSCNVAAPAPGRATMEYKGVTTYALEGKNWLLGNLLLDHVGVLDLNASKQNQFSWYFPRCGGGCFTHSLVGCLTPSRFPEQKFVGWDLVLKEARKQTNTLFQQERKDALVQLKDVTTPKLKEIRNSLDGQKEQEPEVFLDRLKKTE